MPRWTTPNGPGGWLTLVLGILLAAIGLILTVGGAQLAALGGSWYYLIAGLALIASGLLLVFRDVRGAWIYGATFLLTLLWALWEKGLNGWDSKKRWFFWVKRVRKVPSLFFWTAPVARRTEMLCQSLSLPG